MTTPAVTWNRAPSAHPVVAPAPLVRLTPAEQAALARATPIRTTGR